ncbi:zinc finger protein-like 1 homolog [Bradysia coprophila]|uniref:zinc finger protein-like 1 homolog n=1 Tax=Bradysia coprophila TaxID=38358 RepID=UPI00187DA69B|nr:zinc finger protein-like 1 homolog [Bradysia coprophila]
MGLCKCPKRQVTNQFCFDHRVNVCEHCMVNSHPTCVVQSYLQWLKDSDYDSRCKLCKDELGSGDCIRLVCYHVYHWECLNARQQSLPSNTAPSGHLCPTCLDQIFPPSNLISPVADYLRSRLGQVNWGRNELGLPLLSDDKIENIGSGQFNSQHSNHQAIPKHKASNVNNATKQHSVLNIDSISAQNDFQTNSRRTALPRQSPIGGSDRDDNKYKKRTPAEIFSRWSRRLYSPSSRPPWRRTWFIVLASILIFVLVIYVMATLGRSSTDVDDAFIQNHQ